MLNPCEETIVAQCTPRGKGAIALLRLSGNDSWQIASRFARLASKIPLVTCKTHTIHYGSVVNSVGVAIDHVLFLLMRGPRTFTGHDTVEITCHNNPFIIETIIATAIAAGARMAKEGEFSRQAVLNGKIDLLQAEAINELIQAQTSIALKQSLSQVEGSLSNWVTTIEKALLKSYVYCEASFEYLDDEMDFSSTIRNIINDVLTDIEKIQNVFDQQQQIRQGVRVAIIGSVNAGKSSLFNALLGKDRAIVTPIPGTTRDTIEAGIYRDGNYWTLIDTAGLRQTSDSIEQQGIERAHKEAQQADVVLLVVDCSRCMSEQEKTVYENLMVQHGEKIIIVHNKADLPTVQLPDSFIHFQRAISCSCTAKHNIQKIHEAIASKIELLMQKVDTPFLLNQRQFNLLLSLKKELEVIQSMLEGTIHYEILAVHIKDALTSLSSLTGKSVSEQMLDEVFKQFCVGK